MIHTLSLSNELMHQSINQKSDKMHSNNVIIDKYTLEFLQPHIAIGYISAALGKAMRKLGIDQTIANGPYTKRVLVYD